MHPAAIDEAELGQLAKLVACLTPGQQRLMVALADGFRAGLLEPVHWERAWRGTDLDDDGVLRDARTWLARRPHHRLYHLDDAAADAGVGQQPLGRTGRTDEIQSAG